MNKVTPRVIVVDSVGTNYENQNAPEQILGLTLLDRDVSLALLDYKSSTNKPEASKVLSIAQGHKLEWIGRPQSSMRARSNLKVNGDKYHLGNLLSEKEAYDLGYPAPHLDTMAIRMAQIAVSEKIEKNLITKLQSEGLIREDELAICSNEQGYLGFHIINNSSGLTTWDRPPKAGLENKNHPVSLMIYAAKDGVMPVGAAMYVPHQNTVYEFMTYADIK